MCSRSLSFNLGFESKNASSDQLSFKFEKSDDAAYLTAFLRLVMPIAYQFNPDFVIFSVDFEKSPVK